MIYDLPLLSESAASFSPFIRLLINYLGCDFDSSDKNEHSISRTYRNSKTGKNMKHLIISALFFLSIYSTAVFAEGESTDLADPLSSPEYCGGCHQRIYKEWKSSRMAKDINNQKVYQFYTGEHADGSFDGLGFKPMKKGETGDCADCHFPMISLKKHEMGEEVDLGIAMKSKTDHGISCIFCHSVKAVNIKQDADGRYHTRLHETVTLGDKDTRYGPLKDAKSPVHKTQFSALHKTSEMCGSCHLNQENFLSISTYKDWKEAFDAGKIKQTCQQCHMPLIEGEATAAVGGPKRTGLRRHTFVGSYDSAMLKKALSLKVDTQIVENKLIVNTTVENIGAGHKVPGSGPIRNVILKIDVTDEQGHVLTYVGDKKGLLPPLAGFGNPVTKKRDANDWAGMPGKMYAKAYKSAPMPKTGKVLAGVGGFLAESIAFDTTLKVKEPDHATFEFRLPKESSGKDSTRKINIHARLIYRDAFKPVSDKKGWKLEQRPMLDITKTVISNSFM